VGNLFEKSGAEFSLNKTYRYCLWRIWDEEKPMVSFIGLNPSTASENLNDATIRRVIAFAKKWGYGGVYMLNCFPYVSTNPDNLIVTGNDTTNDQWIRQIGALSKEIIFAWGNFRIVKERKRDIELLKMFPDAKALVINKDGSPRHPLYVKTDTIPVLFAGGKIF
jgi:hypothetical protein